MHAGPEHRQSSRVVEGAPIARPVSPSSTRVSAGDDAVGGPGGDLLGPGVAPRARADPRALEPSERRPDDELLRILQRAVQRRSGEPRRSLLGGAQLPPPRRMLARAVVHNGEATFTLDPYTPVVKKGNAVSVSDQQPEIGVDEPDVEVGARLQVAYRPAPDLRSARIGFVQIVRLKNTGKVFLSKLERPRATDDGWVLDRGAGLQSPIYGVPNTGEFSRYGKQTETETVPAVLRDQPQVPYKHTRLLEFEAVSFALDLEHERYLGAVSWGFRTDAVGKITLIDPALHCAGNPTGSQLQALERWNAQAGMESESRNAPNQQLVPLP